MILNFKQKLCQKGFPMVDLQGEGYENWDCYDGVMEYQIELKFLILMQMVLL